MYPIHLANLHFTVLNVFFLFVHPDVDECVNDNGNCSQICVNDQPGYHCECVPRDVLHPDGFTCIPNANCTSEDGNFACQCLPGYVDLTTGINFNCTGNG